MSGVRASIFEEDDLPAAPESPRPAPEQVIACLDRQLDGMSAPASRPVARPVALGR